MVKTKKSCMERKRYRREGKYVYEVKNLHENLKKKKEWSDCEVLELKNIKKKLYGILDIMHEKHIREEKHNKILIEKNQWLTKIKIMLQ